MNNTDALTYCKQEARKAGAIVRQHAQLSRENEPVFYVENRKTGKLVIENCSLSSLFENTCAGWIAENV